MSKDTQKNFFGGPKHFLYSAKNALKNRFPGPSFYPKLKPKPPLEPEPRPVRRFGKFPIYSSLRTAVALSGFAGSRNGQNRPQTGDRMQSPEIHFPPEGPNPRAQVQILSIDRPPFFKIFQKSSGFLGGLRNL